MAQLHTTIQRFQATVEGPVYVLKVKAACPQCAGLRDAKLLVGTARGDSADEPGSIRRLEVVSVSACPDCGRSKSR